MTLLSITILYSFHTPNFLISIVCLLIAIAASFFVSGILCFAISMIYNYIDKKFNES